MTGLLACGEGDGTAWERSQADQGKGSSHGVPVPQRWQQQRWWWWLLWWEVRRVRAVLPCGLGRARGHKRPEALQPPPASLCRLSPSVTTAPVSHRSREGILGSDWLKFLQRLAIGCCCGGVPRLLRWKTLHSQVSAAISS